MWVVCSRYMHFKRTPIHVHDRSPCKLISRAFRAERLNTGHVLWACDSDGFDASFVFCTRCGHYAESLCRGLKEQCVGSASSQQWRLTWVFQGKHPVHENRVLNRPVRLTVTSHPYMLVGAANTNRPVEEVVGLSVVDVAAPASVQGVGPVVPPTFVAQLSCGFDDLEKVFEEPSDEEFGMDW
jgi:hypothetical protein